MLFRITIGLTEWFGDGGGDEGRVRGGLSGIVGEDESDDKAGRRLTGSRFPPGKLTSQVERGGSSVRCEKDIDGDDRDATLLT